MCPVGFVRAFIAVIWEDNVKPFIVLAGGFLAAGVFIGVTTWIINKVLRFFGI